MTDTYTDIMKVAWGEIPEPKLLPVGSWLLQLRNVTFLEPREEGQKGRVLFFYTPRAPMEDVSEDDLAALGQDYDFGENQVTYTIWIESSRDWKRVREHIAKHGTEVDPALSIEENFKAVSKARPEIIGYLDQRSYQTNAGEQKTDNNITAFQAVE